MGEYYEGNLNIRNPNVEVHQDEHDGRFKVYVTGIDKIFISAWQGCSGFVRSTPKAQPHKGFATLDDAKRFILATFPDKAALFAYAKTAGYTKLTDAKADDFCCSLVYDHYYVEAAQ